MNRNVINIDKEKCVGCGICAATCRQSAIEMVDGKATVTREDHCDGLGRCLPVCPVDAISFSNTDDNRPADVQSSTNSTCGTNELLDAQNDALDGIVDNMISQLKQWPVQIKLVQQSASYFNNSKLLVAADCTAYAYASFHAQFMKDSTTIIGCPKLDEGDYSGKLADIIKNNNIISLTVVRMEVPCCGGLERAAVKALKDSGKCIPIQIVTISTDGKIFK